MALAREFTPIFVSCLIAGLFPVVPRVHADEPLPFEEALRTALLRDPAIAAENAIRAAVRAEGTGSRLYLLPDLQTSASVARQKSFTQILTPRQDRIGIDLRWNLFRFGADQKALDAQIARESAASAAARGRSLTQEAQIVESLLRLISAQREVEMLRELSKMEHENLEVVRRLYQLGRVPEQDVQKITIDLENVAARSSEAERRRSRAQAETFRFTGRADLRPVWPWPERIRQRNAQDLPTVEAVFARRPDFQIARADVDERAALASRADRLRLPSLDATFDYGFTRFDGSAADFQRSWAGAMSVSLPIFQRLTLRSAARAADFQTEAAEHRLEELRRKIEQERATLPREFAIARDTAIRRQNLLKLSQSLYQDNLRRYRAGRSNTNELTVDLNRYLQTELNAIEGWVEAHLAFTRLYHSFGKSVLEAD